MPGASACRDPVDRAGAESTTGGGTPHGRPSPGVGVISDDTSVVHHPEIGGAFSGNRKGCLLRARRGPGSNLDVSDGIDRARVGFESRRLHEVRSLLRGRSPFYRTQVCYGPPVVTGRSSATGGSSHEKVDSGRHDSGCRGKCLGGRGHHAPREVLRFGLAIRRHTTGHREHARPRRQPGGQLPRRRLGSGPERHGRSRPARTSTSRSCAPPARLPQARLRPTSTAARATARRPCRSLARYVETAPRIRTRSATTV